MLYSVSINCSSSWDSCLSSACFSLATTTVPVAVTLGVDSFGSNVFKDWLASSSLMVRRNRFTSGCFSVYLVWSIFSFRVAWVRSSGPLSTCWSINASEYAAPDAIICKAIACFFSRAKVSFRRATCSWIKSFVLSRSWILVWIVCSWVCSEFTEERLICCRSGISL